GGIETAAGLQFLRRALVRVAALALPREVIVRQSEPLQVFENGTLVFRLAALGAGVVDAQQELAALLLREQPVEHGGARIADMQQSRRRRREANGGRSYAPLP